MTKNLRAIKASILMGIFLISLFAVLMPSASAGIWPPFKGTVVLSVQPLDPDKATQIIPLSGPTVIGVKIGCMVTGLFAESVVNRLANIPIQISLSVEETPSYCTATVQPNLINIKPTTGVTYNEDAQLYVSFKENAPAAGPVIIKLKMHSTPQKYFLYEIIEATYTGEITFTPAYLPIVSATPATMYKDVSPGKAANFEINLENLGNAKTEVVFKILDVPKGWTASIQANILVGSAATGDDAKKTIILSVTPPYGFGYHDELVNIKISYVGQYFAGADQETLLTTGEKELTFQVRSRGFSTPGFELVFVLFALIAVVFIVKKLQKTRK